MLARRAMTWVPACFLLGLMFCSHINGDDHGGRSEGLRVSHMEPNVGVTGNQGGSVVNIFLAHDPLALVEFPPEDLIRLKKEDRPGEAEFQVSRARMPALCKFDEEEVEGVYVPGRSGTGRVTCRSPPLDVGTAEVRVSLDGKEFSDNFVTYTVLFQALETSDDDDGVPLRRYLKDIPISALAPGPSPGPEGCVEGDSNCFYGAFANGFYGLVPRVDDGAPAPSPGLGFSMDSEMAPPPEESIRRGLSELREFESCIFAATKLSGPETGGTPVLLSLTGSIPAGFQDFFCRFGEEVVEATHVVPSVDGSEPTIITCIAPPHSGPALVHIHISADRTVWTQGGPIFRYKNGIPVEDSPTGSVHFDYYPYDASYCVLSTALSDTSLAELSSLRISGAILEPEFHPATLRYTADVPAVGPKFESGEAEVIADVLRGSGASISVNGRQFKSGQASIILPLDLGSNTVSISVLSRDGNVEQTYILVITTVAPAADDMVSQAAAAASLTGAKAARFTFAEGLKEALSSVDSDDKASSPPHVLEGDLTDLVDNDFRLMVKANNMESALTFAHAFATTVQASREGLSVAGTVASPCDLDEDVAKMNEVVVAGLLYLQENSGSSPRTVHAASCALERLSGEPSQLTSSTSQALRGFLHTHLRRALHPSANQGLSPRTAKCMLGLISNLLRDADSQRKCTDIIPSAEPSLAEEAQVAELVHLPALVARALLLTQQPLEDTNPDAARLHYVDPNLSLIATQVTKTSQEEEPGFVGRAGPITCAVQVSDDRVREGQSFQIIAYAFTDINPFPEDIARGMGEGEVAVVSVESEGGASVKADILVRTAEVLLQPQPQFQGLRIWASGRSPASAQELLALVPSRPQGLLGRIQALRSWLGTSKTHQQQVHTRRTGDLQSHRATSSRPQAAGGWLSALPRLVILALQYVGLGLCVVGLIIMGVQSAVASGAAASESEESGGGSWSGGTLFGLEKSRESAAKQLSRVPSPASNGYPHHASSYKRSSEIQPELSSDSLKTPLLYMDEVYEAQEESSSGSGSVTVVVPIDFK